MHFESHRRKRERKGTANLFEVIIDQNFQNLGKKLYIQIQKAQRALTKRKLKRFTKIHYNQFVHKDKEIFKAKREKQFIIYNCIIYNERQQK